jgi:Zn-dependent peptidase ImmA (M78 family)
MNIKYPQAKEKAEHLTAQYGLVTPVQIFELADLIGIKWKVCDTHMLSKMILEKEKNIQEEMNIDNWNDVLGYYDKKANMLLINNENQPITRKRFTMAHEIGHHQLHHNLEHSHFRTIFLRQDIVRSDDKVESEANYFAGYLLMPDTAIEKRLAYTDVMLGGEAIVQSFAKMFAMSPEAVRIRFRTFKSENPEIWENYKMDEKLL